MFLLKSDLQEIKIFLSAGHVDLNRKVKSENSDITYPIFSIFQTRGIDFVKMLIDIGYQVTKEELNFYYNSINKNSHFKKIVEVLITSKNVDENALERFDQIKKEFEQQKQAQIEQQKQAEFEQQQKIKDIKAELT